MRSVAYIPQNIYTSLPSFASQTFVPVMVWPVWGTWFLPGQMKGGRVVVFVGGQ